MFLVTVYKRTDLGNKLAHYVSKREDGSFVLTFCLRYREPIHPDEFPILFAFLARLDWLRITEVFMVPA
jgi:hypothetical protein